MRTTRLVISLFFLMMMACCSTSDKKEGLTEGYSEDKKVNELDKALYQKARYPNDITSNDEAPPKWHTPSNWDRIKDGMSETQVISVLGSPTSTESIGAGEYSYLFYRGEVPGSGFVSGNVRLTYDRVWEVNKPVFDF